MVSVQSAQKIALDSGLLFKKKLLKGDSLRSALAAQFDAMGKASEAGPKQFVKAPENLRQQVIDKLETAGVKLTDAFKRQAPAYFHESDVSIHSPSYRKVWEPLSHKWFDNIVKSGTDRSIKIVKLPSAKQLTEDLKFEAAPLANLLKRWVSVVKRYSKDVTLYINKPWKIFSGKSAVAEVRLSPDMVAYVAQSKSKSGLKQKVKHVLDGVDSLARLIGMFNKKWATQFKALLQKSITKTEHAMTKVKSA